MCGVVMVMYELPAHRYRELKHFCMQYPDFKKMYGVLCMPHKETEHTAILKTEYGYAIRLIEMTAWKTCPERWQEIVNSVAFDMGYSELGELRKKFFYLLSREKGIS